MEVSQAKKIEAYEAKIANFTKQMTQKNQEIIELK